MTRAHRMPLPCTCARGSLFCAGVQCAAIFWQIQWTRDLQSLLGLVQPATGGRRADGRGSTSKDSSLPAGQQR
jgi:hypothetical protein